VIVDYLDAHKDRFGVEPVCAVLKDAGVQIAPSTYYAARTRPPSARSLTDAATTREIERVHAANFGVYGVRKIHAELHRQGHPVARCTVARLMRAADLRGISRVTGPRTTVPGTGPDTRPDLVDRAWTRPSRPDQWWVADFVRHEAPWIRVEVRDLHRRVVAAARLELRAV
jgi:putative transposase